jgi:serine/threonine protein kinase
MKPNKDDGAVGSVITLKEASNEKFVIGQVVRGGMGEVYQLVPVASYAPALALKTYQKDATREQFIREAGIWISLGDHPFIARAFCYLEWLNKPSILSCWYAQPVTFEIAKDWTAKELTDFTVNITAALHHALSVGHILHQDIKPANILLDERCNPRLTDFGMARFSLPSTRRIESAADIDVSIKHSVTIGPLGGTVPYMAPEILFAGSPPSVQTDIYSLGVSLYEIITGEHPYCGAETGHRFHPILRIHPLLHAQKSRGKDLRPLCSLVVAALELDVRKRPNDYRVLLKYVRQENEVPEGLNANPVSNTIARAGFLRDTGRIEEALALLSGALEDRPINPELLNSFAILHWKHGNKSSALRAWGSAVESLRQTHGRSESIEYPDPAINFAWRLVSLEKHSKASEVLSLVASWYTGKPQVLFSFMEFGWWHLYNRRFQEAWRHIINATTSRTPDEMSLWTLTLAAYLSEDFGEKVDALAKVYLSMDSYHESTALNACVIANFCSRAARDKLFGMAYPRFEKHLTEVAAKAALPSSDWRKPISQSIVRLVMRSLDATVTGGKHNGDI